MSRIGNQQLILPEGVTVTSENNKVVVTGTKGKTERQFDKRFDIKIVDNKINVERKSEDKETKSLHGTTTALIKNMIIGVSTGFKKELELNGVGYRATIAGKTLTLALGFSHPVIVEVPTTLEVTLPDNTTIIVAGIDKQQVGEFSAEIRKIRPPEPYKGKGVKYKDEHIARKEGKRAA